jgi:hypothetical protein
MTVTRGGDAAGTPVNVCVCTNSGEVPDGLYPCVELETPRQHDTGFTGVRHCTFTRGGVGRGVWGCTLYNVFAAAGSAGMIAALLWPFTEHNIL